MARPKGVTEGSCGEAETPLSRPDGRSTSPFAAEAENGADLLPKHRLQPRIHHTRRRIARIAEAAVDFHVAFAAVARKALPRHSGPAGPQRGLQSLVLRHPVFALDVDQQEAGRFGRSGVERWR